MLIIHGGIDMVNNVSMQNVVNIANDHTMVKKTSAAEKAATVADKLELSQTSIDLQRIKASDVPEVSQERLDALRAAIVNGSYKIDYEKLALAILRQNMIES